MRDCNWNFHDKMQIGLIFFFCSSSFLCFLCDFLGESELWSDQVRLFDILGKIGVAVRWSLMLDFLYEAYTSCEEISVITFIHIQRLIRLNRHKNCTFKLQSSHNIRWSMKSNRLKNKLIIHNKFSFILKPSQTWSFWNCF